MTSMERIISLRAVVKSLADTDHSNLGEYLGVGALKPFIDKDLVLGETRSFFIPGTQLEGRGITAERFLEICSAYVRALEAGALTTERQREIAVRCAIVQGACAKLGLIALIDEATGYQFFRTHPRDIRIIRRSRLLRPRRGTCANFANGFCERRVNLDEG